ncbi:hypothetical protein O181_031031 [Austropuccinia psidii MF-1]|uniref:Uncharacterized protein n=1 Tax=Austropuccinia psidii MF-1 TaxID=1389203 RepID=A0A9Q3CZN6_9BASI|nr:hypothetical protein [Austropuccinia psidii MF-1]
MHLILMVIPDILARDVARWTNVGGPIYSSAEVPIAITNNEGVVKRIRQTANSSTNPNAEGSDDLDGEEVELVIPMANQSSSLSPSHPLPKDSPLTSYPVLLEISSQSFPQFILQFLILNPAHQFQTCCGLTSEAISHSKAQALSNCKQW